MDGYSYKIIKDQKFCLVIGQGNVDFVSSANAMEAVANDPSFASNYLVLVDARMIDFHPSYDELMGLKDRLVMLKKSYRSKVAVLTTGHLETIAMLVCILVRMVGLKMKSFESLDEASKWLGFDKSLVQQNIDELKAKCFLREP